MKQLIYTLFVLCLFSCKKTEVVFDIPPLIGKNIDEVNAILGGNNETESSKDTLRNYTYSTYIKEGYLLSIRYNPRNRTIDHFLIVSQKKSFNKYEEMLKIGNLDTTSTAYSVKTDLSFSFFNNYYNVTVYPK